jgi:hypothetical protein
VAERLQPWKKENKASNGWKRDKKTEAWGEAGAEVELTDERWGKIRLRRWDDKHALQDANTLFSVIPKETHLERDKLADPFWLGYQPLPHQVAADQKPVDPWRGYDWRWPVESLIRIRKQHLHWTVPRFQEPGHSDRWTVLVNIGQWQLFLAREELRITPCPGSRLTTT